MFIKDIAPHRKSKEGITKQVVSISKAKQKILSAAHKFIYGMVKLKDVWIDETYETMELSFLYADRYAQTVRYEGVFYFDFTPKDKGLHISMAEELPVLALLSPRYSKALCRFLGPWGNEEKGFLNELAARGAKLYVNYGKAEDYIVIARKVTVNDPVTQ